MKFSEKILLMVILKATKKSDLHLFLEEIFLEKPQNGVKLSPPPSLLRVNMVKKF